MAARKARPSDVDEICGSLPGAELGTSWGDRPTWKVGGKGFLVRRAPHKTAVDPETGEMWSDLLVIVTPDEHEKAALVEDERLPFFTIPHFNGYNAVLVRESRLRELTHTELVEVITDAWATKAPKRLRREHQGED